LVKVPALEESVHFRLLSSALSFDRFANDYAVSTQFAPEPLKERKMEVINVSASRSSGAPSDVSNGSPSRDFGSVN
jgi:hypothetical protein